MSLIVGATAFSVTAAVVPAYTVTFPLWMAAVVGTVVGALFAPITYAFLRHRPLEPAGWTLGGIVTVSSAGTAIFNPLLSLPVMLLSYIATGFFIYFMFPQKLLPCDPMRCANCGYDLTGLPADICPECGAKQGEATPQ